MATITLGAADAPVILDPAQIITEVHWNTVDPDMVTHVAVSLRVRMVSWVPEGTAILARSWWWEAYPPEGVDPADWPFAVRSWRTSVYTDRWQARIGEIPIEGLPGHGEYTPASQNAGFWHWPGADTAPEVTHYRWRNPAGAAIMPTPAGPAISFLAGSPTIEAWDDSGAVGDRETITPTPLVYGGAAFTYVGAAAVREVLPDIASIGGPGDSANFVMWLLFKREDVTA